MNRVAFDSARKLGFFCSTPLVHGPGRCLLKLDNLQASGSFKDRGIGFMMMQLSQQGSVRKFICSSGGNAGMAVATAGERLQIPVEVYVPTTTMPIMVQRLRNKGAKVFVGGANWNDADAIAREALSSDQSARYIPPFDDPLIWEGHSSIVEELLAANEKPDAIVVSVGGGGLLAGVQRGLKAVGWTDVTVVAAETQGTASFRAAKEAGRVVRLAAISSVATSLGALAVTPATLETDIMTISEVVSDAEAVEAVCSFANDFRMLVEPACGAALSLAYSSHKLEGYKKPVVVVCGGGAVNLELIAKWREQLGI